LVIVASNAVLSSTSSLSAFARRPCWRSSRSSSHHSTEHAAKHASHARTRARPRPAGCAAPRRW
jgi:hypothetical protein